MEVSVIGTSHRTAPVEVREKLALPGDLGKRLLRAIHAESVFEEALVLDTCNRTEVYFVAQNPPDPLGYLLGHVARLKRISLEVDPSTFYRRDGEQAVRHLFRVAAALDSQIVGEHEILGQIKSACRMALEARTARFLLNKLLHRAFRVGKRVRTETELGRGSASVAQAAVDLARQIFSDLNDKRVLLVGAGQTAELAARRLIGLGVRQLVVANRTLSRAQELAADLAEPGSPARRTGDEDGAERQETTRPALLRHAGARNAAPANAPSPPAGRLQTRSIELANLPSVIGEVDLVICSTGSSDPVLAGDELAGALRRAGRLLFIVDIAVPRDVDPALGELPNVFLYNINDLDRLVAENLRRRSREVPKAEAIAEDETRQFVKWYDSLQVASTIKLLQQRFELLREAEIKRYGKRFRGGDREQLDPFTQGLCSKILHQPIAFLRDLSEQAPISDRLAAVNIVRQMFDLDALAADERDPA